jgi:hypothetical protein
MRETFNTMGPCSGPKIEHLDSLVLLSRECPASVGNGESVPSLK